MRKTFSVVAVVALLLVAGCSALPGNGSGGLSPEETPPGVSQQGVTNATVLADAHRQALVEAGFEHSLDTNYTMQTAMGNQSFSTAQHATAEPSLSEYRMVVKQDAGMSGGSMASTHTEIWGNESTILLRLTRGNQTAYQQVPADTKQFNASRSATFTDTLTAYIRLGNYTVDGVDRREGTTYVTLAADSIDNRTAPRSFDAQNVTNYTGTMVVDSTGKIHSLDATIAMKTQYGNGTVQTTYRLEETDDVSVERPSWYSTALNRTANR